MATRQTTTVSADAIKVFVGSLGGTLKEVILVRGAKVSDALAGADYDPNSEVRCAGEVFTANDYVDNNDILLVLAGAKIACA